MRRPLSQRTVGVRPAGARAAAIAFGESFLDETNNENQVHESQIALVMRAYQNCNLEHLTELSFQFDQAGKIIDCIGTIKDGGNINHDYSGSGLARLYETARRKFTSRQTSATILPFRTARNSRKEGHRIDKLRASK
jgi:hypothetical protein